MNLRAEQRDALMREAIEMAIDNVNEGRGGPFAALVVRDGAVIARGTNRVTSSDDPTAHAEIVAIRAACRTQDSHQLDGCTLYSTCEPCPMCLGAVYWTRLDGVIYAATREQAREAGFDDAFIYEELDRPPASRALRMQRHLTEEGQRPFVAWQEFEGREEY